MTFPDWSEFSDNFKFSRFPGWVATLFDKNFNTSRYNKNLKKKSSILKSSETFILHNNSDKILINP